MGHQRFYLPAWVPVLGHGLRRLQGEDLHRAGGHAGPGPDGRDRRRRRSARSRQRRRSSNGRAQITMKLRKKYTPIYENATRAAAAEDRAERHDRPARPGHGQGGQGARAAGPSRSTAPCRTSTPTRCSRVARRRHPRLPPAPGGRCRPGAAGPTAKQLSATFKRFEPPRPRPRPHQRRAREASARHRPLRSTTSGCSPTRSGDKDDQLATLVDSSNGCSAPSPGRTRTSSATLQRAADHAAGHGHRAGQDRQVRPGARPDARRPAARRPRARALAAADAAVPAPDHADHQEPAAPVRRRRRSPWSSCCSPVNQSLAKITPNLDKTFKVVNELLNELAYNPPGKEEGFLFCAQLAQPQRHVALRAPGRARARSAAASSSPTAARSARCRCSAPATRSSARLADLLNAPQDEPGLQVGDDRHPERPSRGRSPSAEVRAQRRPHPRHGRVRPVLLRPAALPVAGLRRPDAAQAEGLPLHGLLPGGRPARPGGRRPDPGVPVGKVKTIVNDKRTGSTDATIELKPQFAPMPNDARAIAAPEDAARGDLRRAHPGHTRRRTTPSPTAAGWPRASVAPTVELDEIFRAFDAKTRLAFQDWMQTQAVAITGRGRDLNDAFGTLRPFVEDTSVLVKILNAPGADGARVVRNTGTVFSALSERAGPAARPGLQQQPRLRHDGRPERRPPGDLPGPADLRARVRDDDQPPHGVLRADEPAHHAAAPGGTGAEPDAPAALGPLARAEVAVREPRPG